MGEKGPLEWHCMWGNSPVNDIGTLRMKSECSYMSLRLAGQMLFFRPGLLEACLTQTSVKYHGNLKVLIPLNQRLALTRHRTTGPRALQIVAFGNYLVAVKIQRVSNMI